MRSTRSYRLAITLTCLLTGLVSTSMCPAQEGVSSSSVSMFRSGLIPRPDAILVEDFFNYHRHDIRSPAADESLALDVRWGTDVATQSRPDAYLQVGLATRRYDEDAHIPPLNLAIVVDCSGSMSGERLAKVKVALLAFVHKLRPIDRVSVVTFSTGAGVLIDSQLAEDTALFERAIESMDADGSTNLHAGLMLGYEQVSKAYDEVAANRVILLTDGLANEGVQDSEEIATDSRLMNDRGIDLSTIGVGSEFNYGLLRQLARAGRGLIHFVADDQDVQKVFIDELQSLLTQVARSVTVEIEFPDELQLENAFGYMPTYADGKVNYVLDNLNASATQVLILKFRVPDALSDECDIPVSVRLTYHDMDSRTDQTCTENVTLRFEPDSNVPVDPLTDAEVRKNVTIAELANGFREMSRLIEAEKLDEAVALVNHELELARYRFPMGLDDDVVRIMDMAEQYTGDLETFLQKNVDN